MRKSDELSDRELLIRVDERTSHLPSLTKKVEHHEKAIIVISVVLLFVAVKTYPWIAEALARAFE